MAEINDLNILDASNIDRFPENQAPSSVNNGARALEGLVARWHKDTNASKASTGSANAYVFAADQTLSAYYDGLAIAFDANFENTGAATLNVDAVSADTIKKHNDQDLAAGDIEIGQKVWMIHDGTFWQMMSPTARGGSPITTRGDIVRGDTNGDEERLALGTSKQVPTSDGTDVAYAEVPLPRGYIDGLTLSNNGADALKDIDIAAGIARDDSDAANLALTSTLVKQLDASWAVGTNQGGLDGTESVAGTPDADTWYHAWEIRRSDTGVVDVLFSESATSPTFPTNYDQKRRIGAVLFDATPDILAFVQYGDEFWWDLEALDVTANTTATTQLLTISTPLGIVVLALLNVNLSIVGATNVDGRLRISDPALTDVAPTTTNATINFRVDDSAISERNGHSEIRTNTSSQVRSRAAGGDFNDFDISTRGWIDDRGRNA